MKTALLKETPWGTKGAREQLCDLDVVSEKWESITAKLHQSYEAYRDPSTTLSTLSADKQIMIDSTKMWISDMSREANWGALTSCLLLFLPDIQRLSIHYFFSDFEEHVFHVLLEAGKLQSRSLLSHPLSFSSLRDLSFRSGSHSRISLRDISPLLLMPSLRKFTCQKLEIVGIAIGFNRPTQIRNLTLLDCDIESPPLLEQILAKCIHLESFTIESANYLTYDQLNGFFQAMSPVYLGLEELILQEIDVSENSDENGEALPSVAMFKRLRNLEILGLSVDYFAQDPVSYGWHVTPFDFSYFPPSLEQLTLRNVIPNNFITHFLPKGGNATIPESVPALKRVHVEFNPKAVNEIRYWPFVAWKYRKMRITISWENGNSLNEKKGEVYEFTHDFDDLSQAAQHDENYWIWATGYDEERKIVERPPRLLLSLD